MKIQGRGVMRNSPCRAGSIGLRGNIFCTAIPKAGFTANLRTAVGRASGYTRLPDLVRNRHDGTVTLVRGALDRKSAIRIRVASTGFPAPTPV
jgi:hypothetical protein